MKSKDYVTLFEQLGQDQPGIKRTSVDYSMTTKPEPQEPFVPSALRQVWEWKDAIYQETKHLPTCEALHEILRQAHEAAVANGFVKKTPAVLAETPPPYGGKKQ